MADITAGYILSTLVSSLVAFVAIVAADKVISHNMDIKTSAIIALVALFIGPIAASFVNITFPYSFIIIPLVIWVILGEVLLKETDRMAKLKVIVVAFVVYSILSVYATPYLMNLL